jgi:DNA-binding response OmpR family regulator
VAAAKRILSISNDASLLLTRKRLLELAGYEVVSPESFAVAFDACEAERGLFDLVVVGHSVPRLDKQRIIAHVREKYRCPILALLRPHESSVRGADVSVIADPDVFLSSVKKMLG